MRTITVPVYKFDELSERAKETVLQNMREMETNDDWWYEGVYEDVEQIAEIIGIELDQRPVPLMNGKTRYKPAIYFRGFSSQGDGACFEGRYRYKKGSVKGLVSYAPIDEELHRIVKGLYAIQRKYFYKVVATVKHTGHYYHKFSTSIDVDTTDDGPVMGAGHQDAIIELLRDFMEWIYRTLEKEYEYRTSDEAIKESIDANDYEFTADGEMV